MTMKTIRFFQLSRLVVALTLAASALVYSGCVAVVAAGAAGTGVAWYNGRVEVTLNHSLDDVYRAAQKAVAQLDFTKINEQKSGVDARLISRTATDKKVEITLQRTGAKVTKLDIRIGVFGDQDMSLTLLDTIKSNL